ncbi:MAG: hypothetical protein OXG15_10870 [Gammaproteobacteria bacterium]|nr:hypothetical protein [Gammaproteobacteria bacterium]
MKPPPQIALVVREQIGSVYDELLQVLIDLAEHPVSMFNDQRDRLVEVRNKALAIVSEWVLRQPDIAAALHNMVPRSWRVSDIPQALLEAALWDDYFKMPESVLLPPTRQDRVIATVPSLLGRLDNDGLLRLADTETLPNGIFYSKPTLDSRQHQRDRINALPHGVFYEDLALHYHQFLRRYFTSSIHYGLIFMILRLAQHHQVEARIAIDTRRLRYRNEYQEYFEADYWYGPILHDDKLDDLNTLGLTVHGDSNLADTTSSPLYLATSFRWQKDGENLKSIEIEELVYKTGASCDPILARYLHSIRDTAQRVFIHCDGAVKGYDLAGYPQTTTDFVKRGKSPYYRKVFRLDGRILTHDWSEIVAQWFRGNALVLEYLSALAA